MKVQTTFWFICSSFNNIIWWHVFSYTFAIISDLLKHNGNVNCQVSVTFQSHGCNMLYTKFLFGSERERQTLIQDGGLTTSPLFGTRLWRRHATRLWQCHAITILSQWFSNKMRIIGKMKRRFSFILLWTSAGTSKISGTKFQINRLHTTFITNGD